MCGRYSQTSTLAQLAQRFGVAHLGPDLPRRYNIAPTQDAPIVANDAPKQLRLMRWGLVPSWAKDEAIGNRMINARAETLTEKPSFKKPLERRRCLVLADGFYEWRKGASSTKVPMRFTLKSKVPFAFAGLWDTWRGSDGKELASFTIVTTEANELLRPIHDRMPAILRPEDEEKWLAPGSVDAITLVPLLRPYQSGEMEAYEVSTLVNLPKNDMPECFAPLRSKRC